MFGFINLHKPSGITSRDAVNRVQRLARSFKVGHAGTLDPLASGVLVVAIGQATRLIDYVHRWSKTYEAVFRLGVSSTTEDVDGELTELVDPPRPTPDELAAAAEKLLGRIEQRPPAFSALKVEGRRAYTLARAGEPVELAPRPVEIHELAITAYEYPRLALAIRCASGTYVRSLGRDLAEGVGTAAAMESLVRTSIGPFRLEDTIAPDALTAESIGAALVSPLVALSELPRVELSADDLKRVASGLAIELPPGLAQADEYAAIAPTGELAAILASKTPNRLGPTKCFVAAG